VSILQKLKLSTSSLIRIALGAFDIRDFFVFGGLSMLGYGLYLVYSLALALIICGSIVLILGCVMLVRK